MKTVMLLLILLGVSSAFFLLGGAAQAGEAFYPSKGNTADAGAVAGSLSGASVDSHDNIITHNPAADLARSVPGVVTPNPAIGFAVCDSAYTIGGAFGGFGAAIGIPVSDRKCNDREDAKTTKLLGEPIVAKEIMCSGIKFFKASYRANRPCFPDQEMIKELSPDEMEMYHDIMARRDAAMKQAIQEKIIPIPSDNQIRTNRVDLGPIYNAETPTR